MLVNTCTVCFAYVFRERLANLLIYYCAEINEMLPCFSPASSMKCCVYVFISISCYEAVSRTEAEILLERHPDKGNLLLRPGRDGSSFAITTRQNLNGYTHTNAHSLFTLFQSFKCSTSFFLLHHGHSHWWRRIKIRSTVMYLHGERNTDLLLSIIVALLRQIAFVLCPPTALCSGTIVLPGSMTAGSTSMWKNQ